MITREQAEAIIREQVVSTIFQGAPKQSTFLSMARKLSNMTSDKTRIRVLDFLPTAYWVDGDTGFKQVSEQAWENVYINAGELAVIVPIPEAVLNDAEYDIFGEITPRVNEAIGRKVDEATIFGINRPPDWRADIITSARQAGNNVALTEDLYKDIFGVDGVWDKIESAGYAVTGAIAKPGFRAKLRDIRNEINAPVFLPNLQATGQYTLDGTAITFPDNGGFAGTADLIVGDWSKAVYAIRQDITVKILTEGVIQDPTTKGIVYNLAQQDMVALRVVFRMGWALPNPATQLDTGRVKCPFAYLESASPLTTKTVTFTVQDGDAANVENAKVEIDGVRLLTAANGTAVFNLRAGTYAYKASKKGYVTAHGSVTVTSSNVSEAVTLNAIS